MGDCGTGKYSSSLFPMRKNTFNERLRRPQPLASILGKSCVRALREPGGGILLNEPDGTLVFRVSSHEEFLLRRDGSSL